MKLVYRFLFLFPLRILVHGNRDHIHLFVALPVAFDYYRLHKRYSFLIQYQLIDHKSHIDHM